jgi:predicted nucleic-acid-binding Zn-ribbon protein
MSASTMSPPLCPVCARHFLDTPIERRRGLCDGCAKQSGLWLEPPELRPSRPCQRCGNTQFICAQLRERGAAEANEWTNDLVPYVLPLSLSLASTSRGYATLPEAAPWAPMGILIAFACRACGLTELYTLGAPELPIGPEFGTFLVECAPQGPLR